MKISTDYPNVSKGCITKPTQDESTQVVVDSPYIFGVLDEKLQSEIETSLMSMVIRKEDFVR